MFETDTALDRSGRLKIFISYSRKDALEFADQLFLALVACGHAPKIDRNETMPGEDWRARLTRLILEAETVVFVLTDKAVVSEEIAWEIREAERLAKRIIPILPNALNSPVPQQLAARQFIHFYDEPAVPGSGFGYGLSKLDQAVKRDEQWVRDYVILQLRATRWEVMLKRNDDLIQGLVLADAEALVLRRPVEMPAIEPRVQAFLIACRAADIENQTAKQQQIADREAAVKAVEESQRERQTYQLRRAILASLLGVAIGIAGFLYYRTKETEWHASLRSKAQYLTARANDLISVGDPGTALLLMIEALSSKPKSDTDSSWKLSETIASKANKAYKALGGYNRDSLFGRHKRTIHSVAFQPSDNSRLLSISEDSAWLWVWSDNSIGHIQLPHACISPACKLTAGRFSPDGALVATADASGNVLLWNSHDGTRAGSNISIGANVTALEFHGSGDSAKLLVATVDGKAAIYTTGGEPIAVLEGRQTKAITQARFNRSGTRVVTASRDWTAVVWEIANPTQLNSIKLSGHRQDLNSAEFHPEDDRFIVTASDDRTAIVWQQQDDQTYSEYLRLKEHDGAVNGAIFSPDGHNVLTSTLDGFVRQFPLDGTRGSRVDFNGHTDSVNVLVPCLNNSRLHNSQFVTGSLDGTARVWNLAQSIPTQTFRGHHKSVTAVALDTDCKYAASASADGTVRVWKLEPVKEIRVGDRAPPLHGVAWRPGTRQLASAGGSLREGSTNHFVRFWDEPTRSEGANAVEFADAVEFKAAVNSVMFSPDGTSAIAASDDQTATLIDLEPARSRRRTLVEHSGFVRQAAFNSAGTKVVTASRDGTVRVIGTADGKVVARRDSGSWANAAVFHPNSDLIAIGYRDGGIVIWDGEKALFTLEKKFVLSVAFNPSGDALAAAGSDGEITLWDSKEISTAKPPKPSDVRFLARSRVWSVDFAGDDKLVSGSQDGIVRVWSVKTGELLDIFPGNQSPIRAVSVSPDKKIAAAAAEDGLIRFHDIVDYEAFEIEKVKKAIGRCLTLEQYKLFGIQQTMFPAWCKDKWPNNKGPDASGPLKQ